MPIPNMCCVPNSGNRIGDRDGAANHAPRAAADAVPGACRGPDRIVRSRQQQCSGQAARLAPDGTAAALPNSGRRLFRIPSRVGDINVGDPFNAPPTSGRRLSRAGWAATTPSRLAERDQRNPANAAGRHHLGTAFERSRLPTHCFLLIISCRLSPGGYPFPPTVHVDDMSATGSSHESSRSPTNTRKEVTMFFGTGVCKGG